MEDTAISNLSTAAADLAPSTVAAVKAADAAVASVNAAVKAPTVKAPTVKAPTSQPTPPTGKAGSRVALTAAPRKPTANELRIAELEAQVAAMTAARSVGKVTGLETVILPGTTFALTFGANKVSTFASCLYSATAAVIMSAGKDAATNQGALAIVTMAHVHRMSNHYGRQSDVMTALETEAIAAWSAAVRKYDLLPTVKAPTSRSRSR